MRHIVVCNDKGGVGKTLTAHLLALILLDRNETHSLIECEKTPRLQRIFGAEVDYRAVDNERISEIYENPDRLFTYWDNLAGTLNATPQRRVVDLAAGLTRPFCRWAHAGGAGLLNDGAGLTFAVIATAEREAWHSAAENLQLLRALFPRARFVAVYNERDGAMPSGQLEDVRGVTLKAVRVPAWSYLQNAGRFDLVAQTAADEVAEASALPLGTAARSIFAFTDWLLESTGALEALLDERSERRAYRPAVPA